MERSQERFLQGRVVMLDYESRAELLKVRGEGKVTKGLKLEGRTQTIFSAYSRIANEFHSKTMWFYFAGKNYANL